MNDSSLINKVIDDIKASKMEDDKSDEFVTISIRPGLKNASMIEVFLKLSNKRISSLLTNNISTKLYECVIKNKNYAKAIQNACKKLASEDPSLVIYLNSTDDCLSRLAKNGYISVERVGNGLLDDLFNNDKFVEKYHKNTK